MKILAYQGKSWLSWLIRFQTRSKYSHIAIELNDGTVIEAWASAGVVHRKKGFREGHTVGTKVDVYAIKGALDTARAETFLKDQIGKGYDWRSVIRFISHTPSGDNNTWFCSELGLTAIAHGFVTLLNGNFSEMSPRDVPMSTLLSYEETRKT